MSDGASIPRCTACDHPWHGLRCERHIYKLATHPNTPGPCPCPTSYTPTEETPS